MTTDRIELRLLNPAVAALAGLALFSCTHATLQSYEKDRLTLCCNQLCKPEDWEKSVVKYCAGVYRQIGDEVPAPPPPGESTKDPITKMRCRTYSCDGSIVPDED